MMHPQQTWPIPYPLPLPGYPVYPPQLQYSQGDVMGTSVSGDTDLRHMIPPVISTFPTTSPHHQYLQHLPYNPYYHMMMQSLPPQIRFSTNPQQQNNQGDGGGMVRPVTVNTEQNMTFNSVLPRLSSSTPPRSLVVDSLITVTSTICSSHHQSPCVPSLFVGSSSSSHKVNDIVYIVYIYYILYSLLVEWY